MVEYSHRKHADGALFDRQNAALQRRIALQNSSNFSVLINLSATLQPTDHLELALVENTRFLNVEGSRGASARLFTQRVSRVKATCAFTSRMFVRVIGQYVATARDPSLYTSTATDRSGMFTRTALFAYKLNWQSVMFIGCGDRPRALRRAPTRAAGSAVLREALLRLSEVVSTLN